MAIPRDPNLKVVFTVGPEGPREVVKPAPAESGATASAAKSASSSDPAPKPALKQRDPVKLRRETQGRRGKTVTTVSGISARVGVLEELASALKQKCGAGGALKDGVIEIQGDHREKVKAELEARGYVVKLAGG